MNSQATQQCEMSLCFYAMATQTTNVTQLYSHQLRAVNQIRRSYKNDQSNIFVTVYRVT